MKGETHYPRLVPGHYSSYLMMKMRVGPNTMRTLSKEVVFKDSFDEDDHKRRSETKQNWTKDKSIENGL